MARKKVLFGLVLAAVVAGGVFAQEARVSGEVSLVGVGGRFEYMFSPQLSVGVNAFWTSGFFVFNDLGLNAVARFYPWGKTFYTGLGLGLGIHTGIEDVIVEGEIRENTEEFITRTGFGIVPELGWRIDVGTSGGFFLNPQIQLPLTFGRPKVEGWFWEDVEGDFGVSVGFRVALGLGWSFS